jgi:hypothetical protein
MNVVQEIHLLNLTVCLVAVCLKALAGVKLVHHSLYRHIVPIICSSNHPAFMF